jgi:DNA-binding transcriptional MerR regulator
MMSPRSLAQYALQDAGIEFTKGDVPWSAAEGEGTVKAKELYTIGELAHEFGITNRALRFYEKRGLLKPQRLGRQRLYSEHDRTKLRATVKGRGLGLTVSEIIAALAIGSQTDLKLSPKQLQRQIEYLERQKAQVEKALFDLRVAAEHIVAEGVETATAPRPRRHLRR